MEPKKCIECGKEYEQKTFTGAEQKYCSPACRNKAGNKRREDNMVAKLKREIQQTAAPGDDERKPEPIVSSGLFLSPERVIDLVSTNAHLVSENKRLEERISEMKQELVDLNMQVDELEGELEEKDKSEGMISGVNALVDKLGALAPFILPIFVKKDKPTDNATPKATDKAKEGYRASH